MKKHFVPIADMLLKRKMVLVLGPGGVGKTTCSLAMALAAAKKNKKVAILSIDPAKRLADACGIPLSGELRELPWPEDLEASERGQVFAAMIDQKAIFDFMVRKYSPTEELCNKILKNRLYEAASGKLIGSLEYMAIAKLNELYQSNEYDLIILDTPPDIHAFDFLEKPNVLANFSNYKVMNWLIKPFHFAEKIGIRKILGKSEKLMGGLSSIAGVSALRDISEFLVIMQNVVEGFQVAGEEIASALRDENTGFYVVCNQELPRLSVADALLSELFEGRFSVDGVIFNKVWPTVFQGEKIAKRKEFEKTPTLFKNFIVSVAENLNHQDSYMSEWQKKYSSSIKYWAIEKVLYSIHDFSTLITFSNNFKYLKKK